MTRTVVSMPDEADHLLAPEQFHGLNREFYRANPAAYLDRRLSALLLTVGRPDEMAALLAEGVTYGKLQCKSDDEVTERELLDYATTETTVLHHHASEALLRLFFAHEHLPECPWLELSRLRDFAKFKQKAAALPTLWGDTEQRARVARTFLGSENPQDIRPAPDAEVWKEAVDAAFTLLCNSARRLVDEGPLYNAAKHGLAVVAGPTGLKVGGPDGEEWPIDVSVDGPSLTYLLRTPRSDKGRARWHKGTTWVHFDEDLADVFLILRLINSLWSLARHRYTDTDEPLSIQTLRMEHVNVTVHKKPESPYMIPSISMGLLYYKDSDEG